MKTGKAKLDDMLQINCPTGVKTGIECVGEKNTKHVDRNTNNLEGVFRRENMTNAEKKRMINQLKPKKPLIVRSYYMMIRHVWNQCNC